MANFETITLKNITVNIEKVFYSDDPEYKVFIDANDSDDVVVEFAELVAKLADILYCERVDDFNQLEILKTYTQVMKTMYLKIGMMSMMPLILISCRSK